LKTWFAGTFSLRRNQSCRPFSTEWDDKITWYLAWSYEGHRSFRINGNAAASTLDL